MKKLKILIVDDEEMIQELYEMILETEFDCQFLKAKSGDEAIEKLKEHCEIDLVISDYNMPMGNGGKVYLFNKAQNNIPFFLFSGGELTDYKEFNDFKSVNKDNRFFSKPFNDKEFISAVAQIAEYKNLKKVA